MSLSNKLSKSILNRKWFPLDNAGKIYPAISTLKWSSLFRVAAVLKQEINPGLLQKAADLVLPRFPTMNAHLRVGAFWYYLEETSKRLIVKPDNHFPCANIPWREKNAHLLRILYADRHLAVEFFHAITDGSGAMIFLKTLVAEYLRLSGISIPFDSEILDPKTQPRNEEIVDEFNRIPLPKTKKKKKEGAAYHFPVAIKSMKKKHLVTYSMSASEVKDKATAMGVTITEYLTTAFLYIAYKEQVKDTPNKTLPIRVSVPVNMRKFFPTESVRNFSWYVRPEITPPFNNLTLESISSKVQVFMKEALLPENLYAAIAPNAAIEKNLLIRLVPLPLKNLIIQTIYKNKSTKSATMALTNLGVFKAPEKLMRHIERVEFMLGPSKNTGVNAAIVTTNDTMRIAFTSKQEHPILPEALETWLKEQNIFVTKEVISE